MVVPPGACLRARFVLLALLFACGSDGTALSGDAPLDASADPASEPCMDGGCPAQHAAQDGGARLPSPSRRALGLRIEPASPILRVIDGASARLPLRTYVQYDDGSEELARFARYRVDAPTLGDFEGETFVASGDVGGRVTAQVELTTSQGTQRASATLTVELERTLLLGVLTRDVVTRFDATPRVEDAAREPGMVYPLDGAVLPQNAYPLDVQWTRGAPGDLFRITLEKPHARVRAYLAHDGQQHWLIDASAFRALARTEPGVPASVRVERIDASRNQRIEGSARSFVFAPTALTGTIYYWDTQSARIRRIADGSGTAESFMPNPPVTNDPSACIGCHSISNNGRYMAGRLGADDSFGTVFDLSTDLTAAPAPSLWPVNERALNWFFSTWSPDDTRLLVAAQWGPELRLLDPIAGRRLTPLGTPLPLGTMPDWSPRNDAIAYVTGLDDWGLKLTKGDIGTVDVTGPDTFGASRIIQRGADLPHGTTSCYPSFSPDGAHIAFAHGTGSNSELHESELYLMNPDGSAPTLLARALSGTRDDFQPNFSPFTGGGYYWLTFLSRRVYGNAQVGNAARPQNRRQQIWVTAVRTDATPGSDPSSVPYWLSGQDSKSSNISAQWAPRACRDTGEGCAVGSECCSGDCRSDGAGALVCSPPPPERCKVLGDACDSAADCCHASCVDRVCMPAPL